MTDETQEKDSKSIRPVDVNRVLEIAEGVVAIGDNKYLDGKVAYQLGRLGDSTKSIVRNSQKQRDKLNKDTREKLKPLMKQLKLSGISEELKRDIQDSINDISEEANFSANALGEMLENEIKIPSFKLNSFIAKDDIIENDKVVVKKGQTLVPVKFFTLMGDLIIDTE